MASIQNASDHIGESIAAAVRDGLMKAGEIEIERQLTELRTKLRARLGEMVMSAMTHSYKSAMRPGGTELVITVDLREPR